LKPSFHEDRPSIGSGSNGPGPDSLYEERPAIFGLETEYVVVYVPDEPDADPSRPPFSLIQTILLSTLLEERKAAPSGGLKRGYFLQNGGLVHFEIYLRHQGDTPILEASTPECRSPRDLLLYARAFDHLLTEISRKSVAALAEHGYRGSIALGKNNLDSHGVGCGSHENYLVHQKCSSLEKTLFFLSLPLGILFLLPAFIILLATFLVGILCLVAARLSVTLRTFGLRTYELLKKKEKVWHNLVAIYHLGSNALLFPAIWFFTTILRLVTFRPFVRELTPFLVTRQVFAGSGSLNFEKRSYELSQRARLTTSLSNIIMFGQKKTIYDLKAMLYEPLAVFRSTQKLTITLGDSNLSDLPAVLKIATTALILEMIENGETFQDLRLKRPVAAFKTTSLEGPWKQLALAHGGTRSAIDTQREYLSRAKKYFADHPEGRIRFQETLSLWETVLERLEEKPQTLAASVDWSAKKSLLDGAILPHTDWKVFFAWGHVFQLAGLESSGTASSLDELISQARPRKRAGLVKAIGRHGLDPDDFSRQRDLHFQARKIDLRYHELSASGGYQRRLEEDGLIQRLSEDEGVDRASREPPRDTRARIRGYYILISSTPESINASWTEIELLRPFRHIPLPDPFYHHLPGDD